MFKYAECEQLTTVNYSCVIGVTPFMRIKRRPSPYREVRVAFRLSASVW